MSSLQVPLGFIVGAQRSGTTWVQRLLGAHPQIAAGQESHVISSYLAPLWQRWVDERNYRAAGSRTIGLACYLTEAEFADMLQRFVRETFSKLLRHKPDARVIVEKTPDHGLHLPIIGRLFPDAAIIHVLRDGRDVVASLRSAEKHTWGTGWATSKVAEAAQRWVDWVGEIRRHRPYISRYCEVRYEDLIDHGPETLGRLYDFLRVPINAIAARQIYDHLAFAACAAGSAPDSLIMTGECEDLHRGEPDGFFRQGRAGAWRDDLSASEQQAVWRIAGSLLCELGYSSTSHRSCA